MAEQRRSWRLGRELQPNPMRGLSSAEAAARLARYGPNVPAPERRRRGWLTLLRSFADPMVLLLLAAGAIFLGLGATRDGAIMLAAVAPVILVDVLLEVRAERTLERLRELASPLATVRRDGTETRMPSDRVVPGDVLIVEEGGVVPADGIVESESNFQVDESALTGESLPVSKVGVGWPALGESLERPEAKVYAGTTVLSGRATAIVTATGAATEYGRIGSLLTGATTRPTPIQRAMGGLIRTIAILAVAASFAVAAVELLRGAGWVEAILAGVSLAIAAIPEEFPIVFALFLTLGAWRMARRNALIRRLAGVETLGSITVICSDKTGTLTKGQLAIDTLVVDGRIHTSTEAASAPALRHLLEDALLASEPRPFDPLDRAISSLAKATGIEPDRFYSGWRMVQDYPFDPERKYVTHIWKSHAGSVRLACKGAIEGILALAIVPEPQRQAALQAHQELAARGMRILAVARKELRQASGQRWVDESGLHLVGLIGFADPLREGVCEAIAECQSAGIRVIMITGDHPLTAHAVAESAGILHSDQSILTGKDLERLDEREFETALERVAIFARVLPADKFRIVQGLQSKNQVVAMTGDGINDAPALRSADIGVAMGHRGTDVAREAAAMVLLDDNFRTIVEAIRQGRRIFDNLRRAFLYLIGFHLPIVLGALVIPLVGAPLLLLPIHLVWLELILHPTSALVFEADPSDPDLMRRPPRNPKEPLLPPRPAFLALAEGGAVFLGMTGLYLGLQHGGVDVDQARAASIASLVIAHAVFVFQVRSPETVFWRSSFLANRLLVPTLAAGLASLVILLYIGPFASAALFIPPTILQWGMSIGVALAATVPFESFKRAH